MNNILHLKIGACSIYPLEYSIQFEGQQKTHLQPKFIEVILELANRYPNVISRDELIDKVWSGNYYVGEKSLTNAIWQLRKSLHESGEQSSTIETIRKKGYRLLVEPIVVEVEQSEVQQTNAVVDLTWRRYLPYFFLTILGIGITIGWYYGNNQTQETQINIKTITTEPGQELYASPSPDGRYIAYRWRSPERTRNLYVRDLEQPDVPPKQLTFGETTVGHSVWSNSGKFLFFSRLDDLRSYCHIIRMNISTLKEKKITNCPMNSGYRYINISPDDKTLVFRSDHDKILGSGIYFFDLTKEKAKPVRFSCETDCEYRDRDMAFSPDGKTLLVSRRYNELSENLYLVNIKTKSAEQLTSNEENIVGFSWHPDGKRVVYSTERADVYNGYMINIESKKIIPLNLEGFSFPVFTKQRVPSLFFLERSEKRHISSFDLDEEIASSPFPVLRSGFNHRTPDYSHNSKKIAYVSNESGHYELWISNIYGKNREKLTSLKSKIKYPRWSNDGSRIVFLAQVDNQSGDKLHVVDLESKHPRILPSSFVDHGRPSWGFEDNTIISSITTAKGSELFSFNIQTGNSTQLTQDGGSFGIMPTPSTLLFTKDKTNGLWQLDVKSDLPQKAQNVISENEFFSRYLWGYTKEGIYFRKSVNKHQQIVFYDFANKQLIPIVRLPGVAYSTLGSITFIPDSRQILFTVRGDQQGNIKQLKHPLFD